jgi:hypothetical protein
VKKLSVLLKIIEMKWNVILGVDVLQVGTKVCWVCVLGRSGSWRFHPPWVMVLRALLQRFQVWSNFKPFLGSYSFSPWMDLQHIFITVFWSWAVDILVTNPHSQQKLHQLPLSDLCIENQAAFWHLLCSFVWLCSLCCAGGATLIFETELVAVNGNTGQTGTVDSEL